jgi:hypothetical protein
MNAAARCGAKDRRTGLPCERAPECGRRRCRSHGGAPGSGAPRGNANRRINGFSSAAARAEHRAARELLKAGWGLLRELEE